MDENIKEIDDLEDFLLYIKSESFKVFLRKMLTISKDLYNTEDQIFITEKEKDFIEKRLDDYEILYDIERYVLDGENNTLYIYKEDTVNIIMRIANDMVSNFLNNLVEENILEMCWDPNNNEFMWRMKG